MPEQTIITEEFGEMTLDAFTSSYETEVVMPNSKPLTISITTTDFATGVKRAGAFVDWLKQNHEEFKYPLEYQIQNYDLVWERVWDSILGEGWMEAEDGFLADYLSYDAVRFRHGKLFLWVDTSGLHTGHMVRATINEEMQIVCCEML